MASATDDAKCSCGPDNPYDFSDMADVPATFNPYCWVHGDPSQGPYVPEDEPHTPPSVI
jgi:hypothetical protein